MARAEHRPAKIAQIGIIDDAPIWDHFRRGLRELGYMVPPTQAAMIMAETRVLRLAETYARRTGKPKPPP
jgi:hypothetical protein